MAIFEMEFDVKFDKRVDRMNGFVSPGGYEFVFGDRAVQFDFTQYEGMIDQKDKSIVHCSMYDPDYESFPAMKRIRLVDLANVTRINELFIYTGEDADAPKVEKISKLKFFTRSANYTVKKSVLDEYNKRLQDEKNRQ